MNKDEKTTRPFGIPKSNPYDYTVEVMNTLKGLDLVDIVPEKIWMEVCNIIQEVKVKSLSHVLLFTTPWTVAYQAPLSVGFSRQEYWSRLPFPSPGDLPNPGIESRSPTL